MKISLNNLKKSYKNSTGIVQAVKNISLEIPSNTIFGIIGKSGAGKSTLVRLISLLEPTDSGSIFYGDKRVDNCVKNELIQQRRQIGMIFQNFALFSSRTAGENVAYPMEICKKDKSEIKKRVDELLQLVGLSDKKDAPISTLSGGQKQRIAIARALANKPEILFCDEATSALDPQTTQSILQLIKQIQKQMNLTVVMITHQMEVVRDACEQVAVVEDGLVVEQGSVSQIFENPKSSVTKDFLSHLSPDIKPDKEFVRWSKDGGSYTLRFKNDLTDKPILSELAKKYDVSVNIRAGGIQTLSESKIGTLLVDFVGKKSDVEKAIEFLQTTGIIIEENNFQDGE